MTFKQLLRDDASSVFMRQDEFADEHIINGREMPALIDNIELMEREIKQRENEYADGIYTKRCLVYVKASDFGRLPAQGSAIQVDGKPYRVWSATNEDGVYSIVVEAVRS